MEKAVLKTLIYANLFEFPLTIFEIHKWLIEEKVRLRQLERVVDKLIKKGRIKTKNGYYFLSKTKKTKSPSFLIKAEQSTEKRKRNRKYVKRYLRRARIAANILRIIPWVKLVGISGGLAMGNVSKKDDIDLMLVVEKNRIWLSRLLSIFILNFFRRKVSDNKKEASGKICLNLLLDTDSLLQKKQNIYIAHEVLQMKVCWEKDGTYYKYLSDNEWVFRYLPNWVGIKSASGKSKHKRRGSNSLFLIRHLTIDWLENLAKKFQLWYMQPAKGLESIYDGALYFHPRDYGTWVLSEYKKVTNKLLTSD